MREMPLTRFGTLYKTRNRERADEQYRRLQAGRPRGEWPRMTSITTNLAGDRLWLVASGLDRLRIEGLNAFDSGLREAYRALAEQIAREEKMAARRGEPVTPMSMPDLFVKYRDLVAAYYYNHESFRLHADDTLQLLRRAEDLD